MKVLLVTCLVIACGAYGYASVQTFSGFGDDTNTTNGSLGIIGGSDAAVGEIPWQVSFQRWSLQTFGWAHVCGGSIVKDDLIVTAAHCCDYTVSFLNRIVAGISLLSADESQEPSRQVVKVKRIVKHPKWDRLTINYDVCKLYLKEKLDLSRREIAAMPVCKVEPTGTCLISGWGSMDPNGRSGSDKLQKLYQPVTPRTTCQENYNGVNTITDAMICVGGKEGEGGCKGDSGGPMVCQSEGQCLAGATSWGQVPCAKSNKPTVYANLAHKEIYDFIHEQ